MKLPKLTVAAIAKRDGRRCIHCGTTESLTLQHRGNKGMGGRPSAERSSNGVILCLGLNLAAEAAKLCRINGWKISTHADPSKVSVFDANTGLTYLLADDFTRSAVH